MNNSVAISFYESSEKTTLRGSEPSKSGWQRRFIYDGRHANWDLGCGGSMHFIKLSDGRIVATDDLWVDSDDWSSSIPSGALVGTSLKTRMCRPESIEALSAIRNMTEVYHSTCQIVSGLSDRDAYDLHDKFKFCGSELPEWTARTYKSPHVYASYSSPEGATLTHIKVGEAPLQPLNSMDQLEGIDPSTTPMYILYGENGLQKGDAIDECYVYEQPGW